VGLRGRTTTGRRAPDLDPSPASLRDRYQEEEEAQPRVLPRASAVGLPDERTSERQAGEREAEGIR
jgi:hypothetical protein